MDAEASGAKNKAETLFEQCQASKMVMLELLNSLAAQVKTKTDHLAAESKF